MTNIRDIAPNPQEPTTRAGQLLIKRGYAVMKEFRDLGSFKFDRGTKLSVHRLAPDDEIKAWSTDREHYHDSRPTRRARLLYICRRFSCDPLTKFVENDVKAALTLVESLNAGTHVVESKLTTSQLEAIVYRMESLALFLLKVSKCD
jgi:hypothetical protein